MQVEPYLFFEGRCEEALNFYQQALGAEVTFLMRYKDSPDPQSCSSGLEEKIMHANVRIGESSIMVSDGHCEDPPNFQGFSLSLALSDVAEAKGFFNALSDGGEVIMPLAKTFWSQSFGVVKDQFGVSWMINVIE
ncbi:VOC family protein [Kaarinaea lacus]